MLQQTGCTKVFFRIIYLPQSFAQFQAIVAHVRLYSISTTIQPYWWNKRTNTNVIIRQYSVSFSFIIYRYRYFSYEAVVCKLQYDKDLLGTLRRRQLRWKAEETDLLMGTLGAPPANLHTEPLCLEHTGMHYYQPGCISQTPHQLQPLSQKAYDKEATRETE